MRLHQWLYQWQRLGHVASAVHFFLGGELRCSRPVGLLDHLLQVDQRNWPGNQLAVRVIPPTSNKCY